MRSFSLLQELIVPMVGQLVQKLTEILINVSKVSRESTPAVVELTQGFNSNHMNIECFLLDHLVVCSR